jgi:predicted permease
MEAYMEGFKTHHTWEDWVLMLLGLLVAISPWMAGETADVAIDISAGLAGVLLIIVSGLELSRLYRWQEIAALLIGLWVIISPSIFNYLGLVPLADWHHALGAVIALMALVEIWQDWGLTDHDLAHHGR